MSVTLHSTVKDIALHLAGATRVFERAGIDYCCGGGLTLERACAAAGVELAQITRALDALETTDAAAFSEHGVSLATLVDHIVHTHHAFTVDELERLRALLAKVRSKHEHAHPELADVARAFEALRAELLPHMQREEHMLFPYIVALERAARAGAPVVPPPFISAVNPIRVMTTEHEAAGALLRDIRALTNAFAVPDGACLSYRGLYERLEALERDLHQHIHLENNVLFPRAVELEVSYTSSLESPQPA